MIVRARVKPIEHMPEWALCCEDARQFFDQAHKSGEILEVNTDEVGMSNVIRCLYCKREIGKVKFMRLVRPHQGWTSIAIDEFDFDEGVLA